MTLYPVFILPAIALALVVFYPILDRSPQLSKSIVSSRRRKILLGRLTVVVLLLATLATIVWPIANLNSLIQGVFLSATVLVPALLVSIFLDYKYNDTATTLSPSDEILNPQRTIDGGKLKAKQNFRKHNRRKAPSGTGGRMGVIDLTKASRREVQKGNTFASAQTISNVQPNTEPLEKISPISANLRYKASNHTITDSPAEIHEQLDRVSNLVQSHDIGVPGLSLNEDDDESWHGLRQNHDKQAALSTQVITDDIQLTDLAKMSTNEINQVVGRLQLDKNRLQKLVIAQQTALDTERQAHDQSRLVAKDAIQIMRGARNAQKFAEKLARRERSERIRVEQQYIKVARALNNAKSIIKSRHSVAENKQQSVRSSTS